MIIEKIKTLKQKNPALLLAPLIIVTYFVCDFIYKRIDIVASASIDHRFFIKNSGTLDRDGYARFQIEDTLLNRGKITITKKIACVAGDILETDEVYRIHKCNGIYLGVAKKFTKDKKVLPLFVFNGVIPEGYAFMSGTHQDSWDSRYWGLLNLNDKDVMPVSPIF